MSTTDRHTALAWADSIDAERRATTRGATWPELDAAIRCHMAHDAGCLADIGTESLYDQALLPTRPANLDSPAPIDEEPGALWLVAALAVIALSAAASAWWPWGFALPLP